MGKKITLSLQKEAEQRFKEWVEQALSDFEVAKITFKADAYDWVTFSCQQTLENCLKAFTYCRK